MSDQNQKKPRREPTWFDDPKTHLYADPIKPDGKPPRFRVGRDENNNPVCEVDLGITTEAKFEGAKTYPIKIETPMSPRPFRELMEFIQKVSGFKGECSYELTNWGRPWIYDKDARKNVKAKEDMIVSRFQIAKTEAGLMTFSVSNPRGQSVTFEFKSDRYHAYTSKGQELPIQISSGNAAHAYAGLLRDLFAVDYVMNWVEPQWKKDQRAERAKQFGGGGGGQGAGGYNKPQGQGGGSYQQNRPAAPPQAPVQQPQQSAPSAPAQFDSFDDDIPF